MYIYIYIYIKFFLFQNMDLPYVHFQHLTLTKETFYKLILFYVVFRSPVHDHLSHSQTSNQPFGWFGSFPFCKINASVQYLFCNSPLYSVFNWIAQYLNKCPFPNLQIHYSKHIIYPQKPSNTGLNSSVFVCMHENSCPHMWENIRGSFQKFCTLYVFR
jgi:hypothetical protein